jgi:hypothetical protein
MDDKRLAAVSRSSDLPTVESLQAAADSIARIEELRSASQIGTTPFTEVYQRFFGQLVEPTSRGITIKFTVPETSIEFYEPGPECS